MQVQNQSPQVQDKQIGRFTLCGHKVTFSDLCTRAFQPSINPAEYVDLFWDEA